MSAEAYQLLFNALCDLKSPPLRSEMDDILNICKTNFSYWKPISDLDSTRLGKSLLLWDAKKKRTRASSDIIALTDVHRFTHFIDIKEFGEPK